MINPNGISQKNINKLIIATYFCKTWFRITKNTKNNFFLKVANECGTRVCGRVGKPQQHRQVNSKTGFGELALKRLADFYEMEEL